MTSDELREHLSGAAMLTAQYLAEQLGGLDYDMLMPGADLEERSARFRRASDFMREAGNGQGEVMFRWMAQAQLHSFPELGWDHISTPVKVFFDTYAGVLAYLRALYMPPRKGLVVEPPRQEPDASELIGERIGGRGERTYPGMDMRGVVVTYPPERPGQTVGEMFDNEGRKAPRAIIAGQAERFAQHFPTAEEMAQMTPEERRQFIHLDPRFADPAIVTAAPPLEGEQQTLTNLYGQAQVTFPHHGAPQGAAGEESAAPADPGAALPVSSEGDDESQGAETAPVPQAKGRKR